jgi:hypothetical protein
VHQIYPKKPVPGGSGDAYTFRSDARSAGRSASRRYRGRKEGASLVAFQICGKQRRIEPFGGTARQVRRRRPSWRTDEKPMIRRLLPRFAALLFFILGYLYYMVHFPGFASMRALGNFPADNAFTGIAAIGMTMVGERRARLAGPRW